MDSFFNSLNEFFLVFEDILTNYVLVYFLIGAGIFLTVKLSFPQILRIKTAFKQIGRKLNGGLNSKSGISSFEALATAIAAQVGTGNVAGVATAIASGGPGAVFWMWVSAILGMSSIFSETVLSQIYKTNRDGETVSGPAYYISKGLNMKFLAVFFAISMIIAGGITGNMVQSNSIAESVNGAFNLPNYVTGITVAFFVALVIFGGVKRISSFASKIVPLMSVIYIVSGIIACVIFRNHLLEAIQLIFKGAFKIESVGGAFAGITVKNAMRYGIARGLYSNEAGMGTTPHVHGVANVNHPVEQGLIAMIGVLVDTILVCTSTALIILTTESYKIPGLKGVVVTQAAFNMIFGTFGKSLLAICLVFFAFTTIMGWAYFGESNVRYLFGNKGIGIYRITVIIFIIAGSLSKVSFVWRLQDILNVLMAIPNLIGVLLLSSQVKKVLKDYDNCVEKGLIKYDYIYDK